MSLRTIEVVLPSKFFAYLNPFNCVIKKGGAFILRSVGADIHGEPRRPKEFIFFTNGFFSMGMQEAEMARLLPDIIGWKTIFREKKSVEGNYNYWEVKCPTGQGNNGLRHGQIGDEARILRVSIQKPTGKEVIVFTGIDGEPGQYIYA